MTLSEIVTTYKGSGCLYEIKRNNLSEQLKDLTNFLPEDCLINRRIWHVRNNTLHNVKCFNVDCTNNAKYVDDKCKYVCCCHICKTAYIKQLNMSKYGVSMPSQVKEFAEKISKSLTGRTDQEIKRWSDKRMETNRLKYGKDHASQADGTKSKIYDTNHKIYGTKIPSQSDVIKSKIKSSMSNIDFSDIIARRRQTCIDKYGVDDVMKSPEVKHTIMSTVNTKEYKEFLLGKRVDVLIEKINDKNYEIINYNMGATSKTAHLIKHTLLHKVCGHIFDISAPRIYQKLYQEIELCSKCSPAKTVTISNDEIKLRKLISSIYDGEIISNFKKLISPYEVDIYLPEKQIAFEYNGLYWHNDMMKNKDYHMMKTNMCSQNGIRLIHIWEHEWLAKRNIIESIIFGIFGKHTTIYARKCIIKDIPNDEYAGFCEANHLMGSASASKCYGLYHDNELVQIMSFVSEKNGVWTISRLCSILYTTVIGGADRLFKHFLKNNTYTKIISYSDRIIIP